MRFRKIGAVVISGLALVVAACSAGDPSTATQAQSHEGHRSVAESTVQGLGFLDAKATIEDVGDEPATSPSATPATPSQTASASSAATYQVVVVRFSVVGTICKGEVGQRLDPYEELHFKSIVLPDGATRAKKEKPPVQMDPLDIFHFAYSFTECRVEGITAPPVAPTASGATRRG